MFTNVEGHKKEPHTNWQEPDPLAPANIDVEAIRKKVAEIRMQQLNT